MSDSQQLKNIKLYEDNYPKILKMLNKYQQLENQDGLK
jgi:hypothetical protein